ncbi:MAG: hypothetical protein AB7R90_19365 [Reyranellaceae bacterium]
MSGHGAFRCAPALTTVAQGPQARMRKCLLCREPFLSAHFGRRRCDPCNASLSAEIEACHAPLPGYDAGGRRTTGRAE